MLKAELSSGWVAICLDWLGLERTDTDSGEEHIMHIGLHSRVCDCVCALPLRTSRVTPFHTHAISWLQLQAEKLAMAHRRILPKSVFKLNSNMPTLNKLSNYNNTLIFCLGLINVHKFF